MSHVKQKDACANVETTWDAMQQLPQKSLEPLEGLQKRLYCTLLLAETNSMVYSIYLCYFLQILICEYCHVHYLDTGLPYCVNQTPLFSELFQLPGKV